jgi:hypothetical protein
VRDELTRETKTLIYLLGAYRLCKEQSEGSPDRNKQFCLASFQHCLHHFGKRLLLLYQSLVAFESKEKSYQPSAQDDKRSRQYYLHIYALFIK